MKKRVLCVMLLSFGIFFAAGCGKTETEKKEDVQKDEKEQENAIKEEPVFYQKSGRYFNTDVTISFYTDSQEQGETVMESCLMLCKNLNEIFNRSVDGSELNKINHRNDRRVQVSEEMAKLVTEGLRWYELTEGKLDITVAPLLDLWDFDAEDASIPDAAQIIDCTSRLNLGSVHVSGTIISFDYTDTMLDLGAFLDGYAVDRIKEELQNAEITSALIQVGNTAYGMGTKPDGTKWQAEIPKPGGAKGESLKTVDCTDIAVATVSIYDHYFEQNGIIYHYLLDTESGSPIHYGLQQATVTAKSALQAQALSTGYMLMGEDEGKAVVDAAEGSHQVYLVDNDGELH